MFNKKSILSIALAFVLILSNTMVFAQEATPEIQPDLMENGLSIPERNASAWALNELVDSDRYGLYKVEDLYKNNLRNPLNDEFKESLLKNFSEKLETSTLEKVEKPEFLTEVKNSKTRGDFLRQVYNILVPYEKEENLGKDPIMYLKHIGVLAGNGKELYLNRNITAEEGILFTKRAIDYIYSENNIDTQGLMWKVENKGNTVYLLGSIHYGKPELYPLRKDILDNFSESETLYVEVDITNQEEIARVMMEKISEFEENAKKANEYQDGTTLDSVIDKELYSQIKTIMNNYNIPEEEYNNLKVQGIEQKLNGIIMEESFEDLLEEIGELEEDIEDFEKDLEENMEELLDNELMKLLTEGPKQGVDFYFLDKAKTLNKKVGELESMESQMDLLFGGLLGDSTNDMSEEEQIEQLKEVLENFDAKGNIIETEEVENENEEDLELGEDFEEEINKLFKEQLDAIEGMFDAIKLGDAEKLAEIFTESDGAEMFGGQLLGERDKNMAKKIAGLLEGEEGKTYFIVAGAAHFVVDGTVIDNLTNMGYKVERIK